MKKTINPNNFLNQQPLWYDSDLFKALGVGAVIGFVIGFLVGYEAGWNPVIQVFRPLIG